ncbi:MAG: prepilin-type N-terminal cleavage/methylation domain-containing protein [Planctomycetota bacterium]
MITTQPLSRHRAFTLVEILIVVVILGILASIVIPQFSNATSQSKASATASVVRTVQAKIFESFATTGAYPETIDNDWFVEGSVPINPLAATQRSPVMLYDTAATAEVTHPATKTVAATGAFWYNPTNGTIRALVPDTGTDAEKLELYNTANATSVASLTATTD